MVPISIYIVEDELILSSILKSQLEGFGYEIVGSAPTGEQCLLEIADLSQQGREPEIVLMDIHLKGEIDGIEVAKILIQKFNCAIIFLTGQSSKEIYERSFRIKPFGYLVKPVDIEQTRMTIEIASYQRRLELENRIYQKELEKLLEKRAKEDSHMINRYQAIVENSPFGLMVIQQDKIVFANHQVIAMLDCNADDLLQTGRDAFLERCCPDDRDKLLPIFAPEPLVRQCYQWNPVRLKTLTGAEKAVRLCVKIIDFEGNTAIHLTFSEIP